MERLAQKHQVEVRDQTDRDLDLARGAIARTDWDFAASTLTVPQSVSGSRA